MPAWPRSRSLRQTFLSGSTPRRWQKRSCWAPKGGLAPAVLVDISQESAGASKMVDVCGPLMVSHRFDPQMKVDLFLKDF